MRFPVLIESLPDHRFRAQGAAWDISAEGQTSAEALQRLREQLHQRLSGGSQVVFLDTEQLVPPSPMEHPLARFAGCLKDEPLYDEWQSAVAEYRMRCDQDEDGV